MIHDKKQLKTPTFDEFMASLPTSRKEGFNWSEVNEKERTYNFSFAITAVPRTVYIQNVLFVGVRSGPANVDIHYVVSAQNGSLAIARIPFNTHTDIVSWLAGDGEPAFVR